MEAKRDDGRRGQAWVALALCAGVAAAAVIEPLVGERPGYAAGFAPNWLPLAAALVAGAGLLRWNAGARWPGVRSGLKWGGLLMMVWAANGLPFDLLRVVGLIPLAVDWPGLATRTLALAAAVALGRIALADPADHADTHAASWYGYAAFVCALPYPVLRTVWALGGTVGLGWPGAGGEGFEPWLLAIPWLMAAALSLLLVPARSRAPRRLLLAAGWSATAIVGMIGPAASWSLVSALASGRDISIPGMADWVPWLFYGSWLLWAIAGGAATRSYQLRSAGLRRSRDGARAVDGRIVTPEA